MASRGSAPTLPDRMFAPDEDDASQDDPGITLDGGLEDIESNAEDAAPDDPDGRDENGSEQP